MKPTLFLSSGKILSVEDIDPESFCFKSEEDSFQSEEDSFLVSMQRVAKLTDQYWLDKDATKLCTYPKFGTGVAFRALVVFESLDDANAEALAKNQPPYI